MTINANLNDANLTSVKEAMEEILVKQLLIAMLATIVSKCTVMGCTLTSVLQRKTLAINVTRIKNALTLQYAQHLIKLLLPKKHAFKDGNIKMEKLPKILECVQITH